MLSPLFWAETTATENKNHRIWPLEFRELPALAAVVGKLIIGEDRAWSNIISHLQHLSVCNCVPSEIACPEVWIWITFWLDCIVSRLVRTTTEDRLSTPRAVGGRPTSTVAPRIPTQSTGTPDSAVLRRSKKWQRGVSEIAPCS